MTSIEKPSSTALSCTIKDISNFPLLWDNRPKPAQLPPLMQIATSVCGRYGQTSKADEKASNGNEFSIQARISDVCLMIIWT